MLLFSLLIARNKENGNRKYNPDRLCTKHCDTGLYSAGCEEKIAVDEVVLLSTVQDFSFHFIFLFNYKARDNTNKKSQFTM